MTQKTTFKEPKLYILNHRGIKHRIPPHTKFHLLKAGTLKSHYPEGVIISKAWKGVLIRYVHSTYQQKNYRSTQWAEINLWNPGNKQTHLSFHNMGFLPSITHYNYLNYLLPGLIPQLNHIFQIDLQSS